MVTGDACHGEDLGFHSKVASRGMGRRQERIVLTKMSTFTCIIYIYTYYNMYTVYLLVNASYIISIYLSILFVYKQRAVFFWIWEFC